MGSELIGTVYQKCMYMRGRLSARQAAANMVHKAGSVALVMISMQCMNAGHAGLVNRS